MNLQEFKKKPEIRKGFYEVDLASLVAMAITDLRVSKGLTQAKLARKCGMKQSAIARLEAGNYAPTLKTLERICKAFDKQLVLRFDKI